MMPAILLVAALTPEPLQGPFDSLAAYCAQAAEPERCRPDDDAQAQGDRDREVGQSDLRGDGAITRARVFVDGDACMLAMRVDTGWWIRAEELTLCNNSGTARPTFTITELSLRDVVGSREADLVLRARIDFVHHADGWSRSHLLWVCGVGDGGLPSCLPEIVEDDRWRCFTDPADGETCSWDGLVHPPARRALAVTFRKRRLVIKRRAGTLADSQRALLGRHDIAWLSADAIADAAAP